MITKDLADTFITRAEMARALGKSKTTIRRWEEAGKLKPIKNEHGVNLFRLEDVQRLNGGAPVRTLPKARAVVPNAASATSELAAEVFDRLDRGVHAVDLVKELRVHPDVVEGLLARWTRMRGSVIFTADEFRRALRALDVARLRDARGLVVFLERRQKRQSTSCVACREYRATHCKVCVRHEAWSIARAKMKAADDARNLHSARSRPSAPASAPKAVPPAPAADRKPARSSPHSRTEPSATSVGVTIEAIIDAIATDLAGTTDARLIRDDAAGPVTDLARVEVAAARDAAAELVAIAHRDRAAFPESPRYLAIGGDRTTGTVFMLV